MTTKQNKMMLPLDITVIDAGARYGLHPTWAELRALANFHLFEMDAGEATRLKKKYENDAWIKIHPIALFSENTTLKYHAREHEALNSLYSANNKILGENDYKQHEFSVTKEAEVEARTIDSLFHDTDVHFMKLDVEGAEVEVLKGSKKKLQSSVLGVRSEVLFAPLYDGAPLFGDIDEFLRAQGMELLNFDYTGAGNKYGRFSLPSKYGKLISTDAVWVISNDRLFAEKGSQLEKNVIRLAIFMMLNGATDLAVELLERAVSLEGISFDKYSTDPLFIFLHRKVILLLKSLLDFPMIEDEDIYEVYNKIFGLDFPKLNQFYQSDLFK
jgi:FkbM family methyltransferase